MTDKFIHWLSAALVIAGFSANVATAADQPTIKIGAVCARWEHHACRETTAVMSDSAGRAVFFVASLQIDADGAPRAYHPGDVGSFDYLANIEPSSLFGIQGKGRAVGPAPGFYVSGTSLFDDDFPSEHDTRHWVDAASVPYFVAPTHLPMPAGTRFQPGALAFVVDLKTGRWSGAIFADSGFAVGEGSIALAIGLGLNPFSKTHPPKVTGFDDKEFLYIVFPKTVFLPPWVPSGISALAYERFLHEWGGETRLHALYPACPPLKPAAG